MQLAGLNREGNRFAATPLASVLGATDANLALTIQPGADGPSVSFNSEGKSASLTFALTGTATGIENAGTTKIFADAKINATDATVLAKLLGLSPMLGDGKPGSASFKTSGSQEVGFNSRLEINGLNAMFIFNGHQNMNQPYYGSSGTIEISAPDTKALLDSLGIPLPALAAKPLSLAARVDAAGVDLKFIEIKGAISDNAFAGEMALNAAHEISGDIETQSLTLSNVLAATFLPWNGPIPDLGDNFADPRNSRMQGTIFLRPKLLETGFNVPAAETVIGIEFKKDQRSITIKQPGAEGLSLDINLKPRGATFDITGKGRMMTDLARSLTLADGTSIATGAGLLSGTFKSQGRSPYAVLSALQGQGSLKARDASFTQITIKDFANAVRDAKTSTALAEILAKLERGPGSLIGSHDEKVAIANGVATLTPLEATVEGTTLTTNTSLDLPEGTLSLKTDITLQARADLPAVTISYVGKSTGLQMRNGTSALAAKLGYDLLAKEMAALEALQKQQAALLASEEQQRRDDVERFAAYQAQRAELRQRQRELRIHADERKRSEIEFKAELAEALKIGDALNKLDLLKRTRQLAIQRLQTVQP